MFKRIRNTINSKLINATFKAEEQVKDKLCNKQGQTLVEYALILLLVVIVVVGVVALLGDKVQAIFQKIVDALTLPTEG